jgi:hypothetical protein
MQPSGLAFEGVQRPRCVFTDNDEDVRTLEQHRPDARSISIQRVGVQTSTLLGSLCKPSGRCLIFQNTPEFRSNAETILVKTVRTFS